MTTEETKEKETFFAYKQRIKRLSEQRFWLGIALLAVTFFAAVIIANDHGAFKVSPAPQPPLCPPGIISGGPPCTVPRPTVYPSDITVSGLIDCSAYSSDPSKCGITSLTFFTYLASTSGRVIQLNFTASIFYRFVPAQPVGYVNATFYEVIIVNQHNYQVIVNKPYNNCFITLLGLDANPDPSNGIGQYTIPVFKTCPP